MFRLVFAIVFLLTIVCFGYAQAADVSSATDIIDLATDNIIEEKVVEEPAVQPSDNKFDYPHYDRSKNRTKSILSRQDEIIEKFANVYSTLKKPRILLLVNEDYANAVSDKLEVAAKIDRSVRAEGKIPVSGGMPQTQINVASDGSKISTDSSGNPVEKLHGEAMEVARAYEQKRSEYEPFRLNPPLKAEMEDFFARPYFKAGAVFIDKDMTIASNLNGLVPELLTHKIGEEQTAKVKAIADKADMVIELLVTAKLDRTRSTSGDKRVWVPYASAKAIDLKSCAILATSSSRGLRGFSRKRMPRAESDNLDMETVTEISLDLMETLSSSLGNVSR